MNKSIYEEAIETLNKYRNQNYNSTNKDEVELANAINVILPNYVKQEKLLNQIKDIINPPDDSYIVSILDGPKRYVAIEKLIKEIENNEE